MMKNTNTVNHPTNLESSTEVGSVIPPRRSMSKAYNNYQREAQDVRQVLEDAFEEALESLDNFVYELFHTMSSFIIPILFPIFY
jgi:hypothetical protein